MITKNNIDVFSARLSAEERGLTIAVEGGAGDVDGDGDSKESYQCVIAGSFIFFLLIVVALIVWHALYHSNEWSPE